MRAVLEVPRPTERAQLDAAVSRLRDSAADWARAPLPRRLDLVRSMLAGVGRIAERAVAVACEAKGVPRGTPVEGEEWIASPYVMARLLRELHESLRALASLGNTPLSTPVETADGRLTAQVVPTGRMDALLFPGARADVLFQPGTTREDVEVTRAAFHKAPPHGGKVCLVLGAGNVNSIPAADVATKLFNEGKVCVLKMNPVNAYLAPLLEEAFADAIAAGVLAIVHGGAEEGAHLASHPAVDEIHITGSNRAHDAIVWGPPGPDRAARVSRGAPLLAKEITSELGNVTPVLAVPGAWSDRELAYQADSVAGMVTHNASFNCIAGKMLITPRGWALRDRFLGLVREALARSPARRAWYPGAEERYRSLTAGRASVARIGGGEGTLPWTLVTGLDPGDTADPAFTTEPFCAILSEAAVGSEDPVEFLDAAVRFCNERLWGTLSAAVLVSGRTERDPALAAAVQGATRALRYGTVCVNVWPGMAFALASIPWGAYPGSPLQDVQSGRGFVHNSRMLERVEKTVLRAPAWSPVKLPYFPSHRSAHVLGRRLTRLAESGSWAHLLPVLAAALRA